jgi:hypothetical protein
LVDRGGGGGGGGDLPAGVERRTKSVPATAPARYLNFPAPASPRGSTPAAESRVRCPPDLREPRGRVHDSPGWSRRASLKPTALLVAGPQADGANTGPQRPFRSGKPRPHPPTPCRRSVLGPHFRGRGIPDPTGVPRSQEKKRPFAPFAGPIAANSLKALPTRFDNN